MKCGKRVCCGASSTSFSFNCCPPEIECCEGIGTVTPASQTGDAHHTTTAAARSMWEFVDFCEDIGGMNEPLIDVEPVTLQIGEYDLKIEDEITCVEISPFSKR
ncbi:hypothetical protein FHG87_002458 [Trinorchestia longiramus]|nr:hypothetical protein FHG87_002458 [Trinorchestia longiramus]